MPKYIEFETIKKKINDAQAEKEKFPFNGSLYETGYHNGLTMALTLAMYSTASDVAPVRHGRWLTWEEQFPAHIPSKKADWVCSVPLAISMLITCMTTARTAGRRWMGVRHEAFP